MSETSDLPESTPCDVAFDVLSDPCRRRVLVALSDHGPRDVDEFAPGDCASDADREGLRSTLYHTHLPKLADCGYIEWDRAATAIRRGPDFDEIAPLLDVLVEHEDELPADRP